MQSIYYDRTVHDHLTSAKEFQEIIILAVDIAAYDNRGLQLNLVGGGGT